MNSSCVRYVLASNKMDKNFLKPVIVFSSCFRKSSNQGGYFILAPDMPSDTEDNNPLLRIPKSGHTPKYTEMNNRSCFKAFVKRVLLFESCIDDIELEDVPGEKKLIDVISEIEEAAVGLDYSFATINHLAHNSNKFFKFPNMSNITNSYLKTKSRKGSSRRFYELMKSYESTASDKYERRWIEKHLIEGKLNGLELNEIEMEGLQAVYKRIREHSSEYTDNVNKSNFLFRQILSDPKIIDTLPEGLFGNQKIRDVDPVTISKLFLGHCSDRSSREIYWGALNRRAFKNQFNNSVVIENIRKARREEALILGFDNFAQKSLSSKMAGSVENVRSVINKLHNQNQPLVESCLGDLADFAKNHSKGKVQNLELWDLEFYRKQYISSELKLDDEIVQMYFPLSKALQGLFDLLLRVFQVQVEELPKESYESWNGDVRLFKMTSSSGASGSFFFDPYERRSDKLLPHEGNIRLDMLLPRSSVMGTDPLSCLTLNRRRPVLAGQDVLLKFSDLRRLFQMMGSLLQHTLTEVPFCQINGLSYVETDASRMVSEFLDTWLLHDYKTVADCSAHVKTQEPLPKEMHDKLRQAQNKFLSLDLSQQIYNSGLDLALYSNHEFWEDIVEEVWKTYLPTFKRPSDEARLCSFNEIMTEQMPAAFYSILWSDMLAADVYSCFDAVKSDEKKLQEVGMKFKNSFISMSGGKSTGESFRDFVGREPNPTQLLALSQSKL